MIRSWTQQAIARIERDYQRTSDTHLFPLELPGLTGVDMYVKDESTHPTGSLKHRLARSLFLYGLCNGWIKEGTAVVEASSGSTAVSEAYFARMLGLPFIAVMPRSTSPAKIAQIEFYGGQCSFVDDPAQVYAEAARIARERKGHNMDQFTYAERATDWRGNNNIAESIFNQMKAEPHPLPTWVVVGAGTGGTSATIGRYIRYQGYESRLCVVDPPNSVFHRCYESGNASVTLEGGSDIEGIGRPRVESSFMPGVIDRMLVVPNEGSYAAMRYLEKLVGKRFGASTGTDFYGALRLACEMKEKGQRGSIVAMACDPGERYLDTYYSDAWLEKSGYDIRPYESQVRQAVETGRWSEVKR